MSTPTRSSLTRTGSDGREREYLLSAVPEPRAVVLAFHPYGFDPEAVLDGELPGARLIRPLPGIAGPAAELGLTVVAPRGLGRVEPAAGTLGHDVHVDAAVTTAQQVAEQAGVPLVGLGLSLGGQETLLAAARHPEALTAVCSVNPIADLAAWYDDMVGLPISILTDLGVPAQVAQEVGGTPQSAPELYRARSAVHLLDGLSRVPVRLVWSPQDTVIPNGARHQAGRLAAALRERGAPVDEQIVTHAPVDGVDAGRFAHESFDAWEALGYLAGRSGRPAARLSRRSGRRPQPSDA